CGVDWMKTCGLREERCHPECSYEPLSQRNSHRRESPQAARSRYHPPDGNPLIIGEDVTVGHKVMLHGCTIGNRVLVGMGSIVLDGAIIEDDVMIGAGSLVPQHKRLESGYLYLGSPVKQIRPLSDAERSGLQYSANNYVKWKDDYLSQDNHIQP
ncbi:gamma carbonic anhydrase family protein, partial [Salmonella enterica]|uniref:gamma carbonic anhydrase family protein n=1 Tax=Salmonella enterica TaxID=28901 RepID=UPI001E402802